MTDKQTEALKLALEALEKEVDGGWSPDAKSHLCKAQWLVTQLSDHIPDATKMMEQPHNGLFFGTSGPTLTAGGQPLAERPLQTLLLQSRGAGYGPAPSQRLEISKTEQPAQEPVAWMRHDGTRVVTAEDRENYPDYETRYPIPLYTSPPASKPLTDEEISDLWDGHVVPVFGKNGINPIVFARAIEAAHGIGEQK